MTHEMSTELKLKYLKWEGFGNTDQTGKQLAPTKPWMRLGKWEHHFLTGSVREHIMPLQFSQSDSRLGTACIYQVSKIGSKL